MRAGYTCLSIAGGWRCGPCVALLLAAGAMEGTAGMTPDPLPPTSRGAIPRETAATILPPTKHLA